MRPAFINANALHIPLASASVQCVVTSPPYYGLRDYDTEGQIGLESTPEAYVENLVAVFREVRRVLKDDGVLWLNLGDSYWGGKGQSAHGGSDKQRARFERNESINHDYQEIGRHGWTAPKDGKHEFIKPKDLIGIPWMVAFALRNDGWYLRQDIIWNKPNPMPESMTDRCTKSHEYIFLFSKSKTYYYDQEAIKEPAAIESLERLQRGVSENHKNVNGAPGQTPHSMNKPRLNVKRGGFNGKTNSMVGREAFREFVEMRNKRSVWTITTKPYKGAHFATFPPELPETCILAGSKPGDIILDPFSGAGTTGIVARILRRAYVGLDLSMDYLGLSRKRLLLEDLENWGTGNVMPANGIYHDLPLFIGLENDNN